MSDPVLVKTGIAVLAEACPKEPPQTWDMPRTVLKEGFQSIDDRLQKLGPLAPDRFSLQEANTRWNEWAQGWRWRAGASAWRWSAWLATVANHVAR